MSNRLAYLCLQATKEGQASYAHVHEIIKGLEKRGFTVDLYEPIYRTDVAPGPLRRLWWFLRVEGRLMLRLRSYDAVYIRNHFASLPVAWVSWILGVPVVQEVNGAYEDLFVSWPWTRRAAPLFAFFIRTQLALADAVVAVTDQLAKWVMVESKNHDVHTISNGADTDLFKPRTQLQAKTGVPPYVIFFGALSVWQGVDLLIQAAGSAAWPQGVSLMVAGDGMERAKIEDAAARMVHVVYLGRKDYRELPDLIAGAVAGLCPKVDVAGYSETGLMPLKLFETMACGIPVVVTEFPGQADVVREHASGLVIPQGDAGALAAAVAWLVAHPEEAASMGQNGREAVVAHHSWDRRAADTAEVLACLLNPGAKA